MFSVKGGGRGRWCEEKLLLKKTASLQPYLSQPQCIRDHRNRAEAHGCGGEDRLHEHAGEGIQHTGSDGDSEQVVDEREEKILADVAHGGAAKITRAGDGA